MHCHRVSYIVSHFTPKLETITPSMDMRSHSQVASNQSTMEFEYRLRKSRNGLWGSGSSHFTCWSYPGLNKESTARGFRIGRHDVIRLDVALAQSPVADGPRQMGMQSDAVV
ncbi:hypothetical protein M8818_001974 [Zalaria obscura]|uniref:Uncharacterized protein n=1 Tax=Zalaria obscura TaxID=2024903 RepID=A0ACC3SLT2_9PEZI